jgi:hypothetical protein
MRLNGRVRRRADLAHCALSPSRWLGCAAVIRLRSALVRALEKRWVGPLVLVILIVLLAFVGLHVFGDHFEDAAAATCGGLLIVTVFRLVLPSRDTTGFRLPPGMRTAASPALPSPPPELIARSLPQIPLLR